MKKHVYIFLFSTIVSAVKPLQAQHKLLDSLKQIVRTTQNDTQRVNALNDLSVEYRKVGNYDTALLFAQKALAVTNTQTIVYKIGRAKAFTGIGNVYNMTGNWPESLKNYFASLKIMEECKEKKGIASCYGNIGKIYYYQGNYKDALKNNMAALQIREELKDKRGMIHTLNNIAHILSNQEDYDKAKQFFLKVLKLIEETSAQDGTPVDKQSQSTTYEGLGNVYYYQNKFPEALKMYETALQLETEIDDKQGIASSLINLGGVDLKLKKLNEALSYCNRGLLLAKEIGVLGLVKEANENLAKIYEELAVDEKGLAQQNHLKLALQRYKDFISARDSLVNDENTKKTVQLEMNFEFDKKEATAKLEQEKREAISLAERNKQKSIIFSMCCILLMVMAFAIFAYRSFLQKQKANKAITLQKELIEEKQREILDSIHYAKRIQTALMPSEKYIARNLKKGVEGSRA